MGLTPILNLHGKQDTGVLALEEGKSLKSKITLKIRKNTTKLLALMKNGILSSVPSQCEIDKTPNHTLHFTNIGIYIPS